MVTIVSLRRGQALGRYQLERRVAMGGMAEIWSALDTQTSKLVALKVLLPELAVDPALRTMFMDEVRLTMRLKHPNIVRVDGVFEVDNWLFHAMELLEGKDVRRLLSASVQADQRFPVSVAVKIASAAARALAYAHSLKSESGASLEIVHRDISPHNILVCSDGTIKVLDFGIARAKERATKTAQGVIKGKLAYMSPEQAVAQPVTAQTDVFALGIVLWEMLAMRRLFAGNSDAETLNLVCEARVPALKDLNSELPDDLDELVRRMLALKPRDRMESMRAVDNALKRVLYQGDDGLSVEEWVAPLLEDRPKTQVRSPASTSPAGTIAKPASDLKKTRAEGGAFDKTEAHSVDGTSDPFTEDSTTAAASKSASPKTDATTPSPVPELMTEAIDASEMSQTIQEPDETEHVPLPSTAEISEALEDANTFEADFKDALQSQDRVSTEEASEDEIIADTAQSPVPGLRVGQPGRILSDGASSSSVDPLASTSLYPAERRENLAGRDETINLDGSERLRTKSGSLVSEAHNSAELGVPAAAIKPEKLGSKSKGLWLLLVVMAVTVGVLLILIVQGS